MFHLFPTRQIALSIGFLSVHWYGVMYAAGFILGIYLLRRLQHHRSLALSDKKIESLFLFVFLGVILGGRLGYVLFYGGAEYWKQPLQILAVWNGGMASHGGFIGVAIALFFFCRRHHVSFIALTDVLVIPVALGLALGRLGNLINGELYGTITTLPWGMTFPGVDGLRHPTQIYAIAKDLTIAFVCFVFLRRKLPLAPGYVTALFLMLYAFLRFIVEIFRDQPIGYTSFAGMSLSRGQVLTLPVFVLGVIVLLVSQRKAFGARR